MSTLWHIAGLLDTAHWGSVRHAGRAMNGLPASAEAVWSLLATHHSARGFRDDPVEDALLERIALALATALLMVWAMRTPAVRQWRGVSPLVRLGQMSYSVFLIHFAVCLLVNAVVSSLWPASPWVNALGMLLAFSLAMVAGQWLYRTVEQRTPTLPTMLRWQASLVAAGVLVQLGSNWG